MLPAAPRIREVLAAYGKRPPQPCEADIVRLQSALMQNTSSDTVVTQALPFFCNPGLLRSRSDLQDVFYRVSRTATLRRVFDPLQVCTTAYVDSVIHKYAVDGRVDYDGYRSIVRDIVAQHPVFAPLFTPRVFILLPQAKADAERAATASASATAGTGTDTGAGAGAGTHAIAIAVDVLEAAIFRIVTAAQSRIGLTTCDVDGHGYLIETDVEQYIRDLSANYPHLQRCDDVFRPFFLCTMVRPLFYFLDPIHRKRVSISDLLVSPYLSQIFTGPQDPLQPGLGFLSGPLAKTHATWFSFECALDLYTMYVRSDADQDGLLSADEVMSLPTFKFTGKFVRQLLQSVQTFAGKIDYRAYIDLMLVTAFPRNKAAAKYAFNVFDIGAKGYVSRKDIEYFLSDIMVELRAYCADDIVLDVNDFIDEIYDMIKPGDGFHITLHDVLETRSSELLISYLMDPTLLVEREMAAQRGAMSMKQLPFET